jgi:cellulose synthase/poly-beta-1,6-N-acetylglucosamine synthase-like glycosyltransferase
MSNNKISHGLSVSVIVPVHRIDKAFNECINSVIKTLRDIDELIIIADGIDVNSINFLAKWNIKILSTGKISGPAVARNSGAQIAKGDLLFFVDSDVTIQPDAILKVASIFNNDKEVKALIGSYDDEPADRNFISQYKNLFHHYIHQTSSENASTFWGACGVIRKDVFIALNGYDESYSQPSIEDIELGYRIINAGYKILLHKNLQIKHFKRWSFISLIKTDFFNRALPWTKLMFRHNRFLNDLNLKSSSRISVFIIFIFLLFLAGSIWRSEFFIFAGISSLLLLIINLPVYRFFHKKRGLLFALKVIPLHWLYFIYSGLAFGLGTILYKLERFPLPSPENPKIFGEYVGKPVKEP